MLIYLTLIWGEDYSQNLPASNTRYTLTYKNRKII